MGVNGGVDPGVGVRVSADDSDCWVQSESSASISPSPSSSCPLSQISTSPSGSGVPFSSGVSSVSVTAREIRIKIVRSKTRSFLQTLHKSVFQ